MRRAPDSLNVCRLMEFVVNFWIMAHFTISIR
jgi:hypothetical protein